MRYLFLRQARLNPLLSCISWEQVTDLYAKCCKMFFCSREQAKNNTANKYFLPSGKVGNVVSGKHSLAFNLFSISRIF